ncbi:MAG: efflux RND transporter permease subunit [Sandaracinaceae bacterium]|nr:efflux RND transporter permease subunit [Sandaracinaceae bacterium]
MGERIVDFSVRHRFVVILLVLMMGALGVRAARELPIDAVPDATNEQVLVLTNAPSLGPLEVERFITFPIESVMSGLPNLEEVRSVSRFGVSAVTLVFEEGTDIYFARQLVSERLGEARQLVPPEYGLPELGPISTGLGDIYLFEVRAEPMCEGEDRPDCYTLMELREILDWYLAYHLRAVDGVVEVNATGGELKTFEVRPDPTALRALGLGIDDVFEALRRNNTTSGGGYIVRGGEQRLIRADGLLTSVEDVRRVAVTTRGEGVPIRLGDVAEVVEAPMIRQGAATRDGRGEIVSGIVMMLIGENSREVSQAVDARLAALAPTLPEGVTIETVYDRTELVDRTIRTAVTNLIEGGVLVIVVLLLLLGNVRGGLLVASVIPLSMLAALIAMEALGVSGNLMSLGALDFGIVVDAAVVIVEQVVRSLSLAPGGDAKATVQRSAREMARPVLFAVGIIMLVYVPVLSLEGVEGRMFRPMAWTVLFALGASIVIALTLIPAASSLVLRAGAAERETWAMRAARRLYEPALAFVMLRPWVPFLGAIAVVGVAIASGATLGAEFLPRLDEGSLAIEVVRPASVSLDESVEATSRMEEVLLAEYDDEVRTVLSRIGRSEIATDPMGFEQADVYVVLEDRDGWTHAGSVDELADRMKASLEAEAPGQNYMFSQPIELRTNELVSGVRADVAVYVYGEDLEELARIADDLVATLSRVPGAADVSAEQLEGLPSLDVVVDRDALARYGIDAVAVTDAVATLAGHRVGQVFEGQRRFALQVRMPPDARDDLQALRELPIARPGGGTVPLGQLASLEPIEGPATISREAIQRRLTVQVNVRDRDLAGFVAEARARVRADVDMPPGYFTRWGGQFENLERASARLGWMVPLVLLLIFTMLFATYGAARPAWLVFLNVPFAATGGVIALAIRQMPFSISAGVGFIALFGIAVLNGVVLVSTIRELQAGGTSLAEASSLAAKLRLRPVLMTALTDAIGFFPMAFSTSAGAEVQRPLATVVIGGLVTCTSLTLFLLPALYARLGGAALDAPTEPNGSANP